MAEQLKKKIKPGQIEAHAEELAIVVHYEVQEVSTLPDGTQKVISKEAGEKKISVKTLSDKTNVPLLATEIIEKCKLIHPSKAGQVEELLYQLQHRGGGAKPAAAPAAAKAPVAAAKAAAPGAKAAPAPAPAAAAAQKKPPAATPAPAPMLNGKPAPKAQSRIDAEAEERAELQQRRQTQAMQIFKTQQKQYEPAFLNKLDEYIEGLYEEEMPKKVRAMGMIAQLFRNTENFEPHCKGGAGRRVRLNGGGQQVRRVADQCLDIIMDTDEEWAVRIRNLKFESFNQEWLDVVAQPPDQMAAAHARPRHGYDDDTEVDYSGGD
ncbi:Kinesin-associated protein 3, partial [Tetrabaena socialis]